MECLRSYIGCRLWGLLPLSINQAVSQGLSFEFLAAFTTTSVPPSRDSGWEDLDLVPVPGSDCQERL